MLARVTNYADPLAIDCGPRGLRPLDLVHVCSCLVENLKLAYPRELFILSRRPLLPAAWSLVTSFSSYI